MQGRIDLLHGLIGGGVLIHPDYPVMKFQKEASAGFWKGITIGEMVVTEFFFLPITMRLQEGFCFSQVFRFIDVEIQITEFPVFRNRVAGSQTDAFEKNTGDAVFLKKRDGMPGEGINLVVVQHHIFGFLQHGGIERGIPKARQHKRDCTVFLCQGCQSRLFFHRNDLRKRSVIFKTTSDKQ